MPLTDFTIRNAKYDAQPNRLFDERGLYLELSPSDGKWRRFKHCYEGKEKLISLGTYPDGKLKEARELRDDARKLLAPEIDPSEHRKAKKASRIQEITNSFEAVVREWYY